MLLYAAIIVLLGGTLRGGLDPIYLSLLSVSFLYLIYRYAVRRSLKPGELRFAKLDTKYSRLRDASLRIKSKVKTLGSAYASLNIDLTFENPHDLELFCNELERPGMV